MAFGVYSSGKSEKADKVEVDYDALNKYVVEACNLEQREVLVGYVSAIVDLGEQNQEDAEVKFDGDAAAEAAEIEKNPNTYFKDGVDDKKNPIRLKCWPQKACQSVAVAIDFPEIMLDKGQFFGESNPQPLRVWMGGQFWMGADVGMVVARPTPLKVTNINKQPGKPTWSFAQNHLFYKMAVDAKLVTPGEPFLPKDIDKLLGKSFQFQVQIYFKESKGKSYYTEWIKYQGARSRSQQELVPVKGPFTIQFFSENDPEAIKELRYHVINTMKNSPSFPGSVIESQLQGTEKSQPQEGTQEAPEAPRKEEPKPTPAPARKVASAGKPKPPAVPQTNFDDLDDDIPF